MHIHDTNYLFVYGTLTRVSGHIMHQLLAKHSHYIDEAYLYGRLYDLGHYPAAVLSRTPTEKVYGELYEMDFKSNLLLQLDDYEECTAAFPEPHEYRREQVQVYSLSAEKPYKAWSYLYKHPVNEHNRVISGRYS